jgi:hypothetical protein
LVDEISDAQVREPGVGLARSRRTPGTNSLLVQDLGDFGKDVIVEERVDEFDDRCLDLLRGGLGIKRRQGLGLAAREADMDLCRSFGRKLDQRDVLDDVGE